MILYYFQGKVGFKHAKKKSSVCGQTVGFAIGMVSCYCYSHSVIGVAVPN